MFSEFFKRYIKHPIGILVVFVFFLWTAIRIYPKSGENQTVYILSIAVLVLVFILYTAFVCVSNRIPRASKSKLGILVLIHAVNDNVYNDIRYNVEINFREFTSEASRTIQPIYINTNKTKVPSLSESKRMVTLLQKTNCVFCVDLILQVDDSTQAESYLLKTNSAIIHPRFSEEGIIAIRKELNRAGQPLKIISFNKSKKLQVLSFTTQQMAFAVQYLIGLVFLFSGNVFESEKQFSKLLSQANATNCNYYKNICEKYSDACDGIVGYYANEFKKSHDVSCLDNALSFLAKYNQYSPGTYSYHLNAAWLLFLKDRSVSECKQHITKCKQISSKNETSWMLSDVFLLAYESNNAGLIYRRYKATIKSCSSLDYAINYVDIIAFIEYVLECEPEKIMLNLVLAILYDSLGDISLSIHYARHFNEVHSFSEKEKDVKKFITALISNPKCDNCHHTYTCDNCRTFQAS